VPEKGSVLREARIYALLVKKEVNDGSEILVDGGRA